jgi:hypothetical protein
MTALMANAHVTAPSGFRRTLVLVDKQPSTRTSIAFGREDNGPFYKVNTNTTTQPSQVNSNKTPPCKLDLPLLLSSGPPANYSHHSSFDPYTFPLHFPTTPSHYAFPLHLLSTNPCPLYFIEDLTVFCSTSCAVGGGRHNPRPFRNIVENFSAFLIGI